MSRRRADLLVGVLVGIVLGICVISAFVFLGSEGSIDSPRISGVDTGKPTREAGAAEPEPGRAR